jgi:hypothetical protein
MMNKGLDMCRLHWVALIVGIVKVRESQQKRQHDILMNRMESFIIHSAQGLCKAQLLAVLEARFH